MLKKGSRVASLILTLVLAVCVASPLAGAVEREKRDDEKATATEAALSDEASQAQSALDFKVKDIDGKDVNLSDYKGKVVMIVNVASKCGLTPQYEQLSALYGKYKEQGFTILGFPANNFNGQEPGTEPEIKQFCTDKYHVEFPLFSKISVKGDDKAPLYQFLTAEEKNGDYAGEIAWNFNKFLVGRDGKVIARFEPKTKPDAPEVTAKIEEALKPAA